MHFGLENITIPVRESCSYINLNINSEGKILPELNMVNKIINESKMAELYLIRALIKTQLVPKMTRFLVSFHAHRSSFTFFKIQDKNTEHIELKNKGICFKKAT